MQLEPKDPHNFWAFVIEFFDVIFNGERIQILFSKSFMSDASIPLLSFPAIGCERIAFSILLMKAFFFILFLELDVSVNNTAFLMRSLFSLTNLLVTIGGVEKITE